MRQGLVVSILILNAGVVSPHGQTQRIPVGTSTICGTVTASDTGLPLKGARVTITGHATARDIRTIVESEDTELERIVDTDLNGTFSFARMPAGVFQVSVESPKKQYLDLNYGERRPGGDAQFIRLTDGQKIELRMSMLRPAVITGRVVGPDGAPLADVEVEAMRYETMSGFRRLDSAAHAETDDRGIYRLSGLRPGNYFVVASPDVEDLFDDFASDSDAPQIERAIRAAVINPRAGTLATIPFERPDDQDSDLIPSGFRPTYAPAALSPAEATVVTVAGSDERTGVDIFARAIPTSIIKVSLTTGDVVRVSLINDDPSDRRVRIEMHSGDDFTIRNVSPGTYTIGVVSAPGYVMTHHGVALVNVGTSASTDSPRQWARTRVTVSGEPVVPVSLSLQPTRSISGVVAFDLRQRPDLTQTALTVRAWPTDDTGPLSLGEGPMQGKVTPDGRFTIAGVPGGRYYLDVNESSRIKSAMVGRQDTLDFPLDFAGDHDVTDAVLTITDRPSQLNGSLIDSTGQPALDYSILIAPTDSRYWCRGSSRRIRTVRVDLNGQFDVKGLPPGSYQLAVVPDPEPGWATDPEFLRTLAGMSVTVIIPEGGGTVTQHLRVK